MPKFDWPDPKRPSRLGLGPKWPQMSAQMAKNGPKRPQMAKTFTFRSREARPAVRAPRGPIRHPRISPEPNPNGPPKVKIAAQWPKMGPNVPPAPKFVATQNSPQNTSRGSILAPEMIQRVENGLGRSPQGAQPTLFILTRILPRRGPPNREFASRNSHNCVRWLSGGQA